MQVQNQVQFTRVCAVESFFEGQQLSAALGRAKIPSMVRSYHDIPLSGSYQPHQGFGEISVPVSRAVESESILDRAREEIRTATDGEINRQALRTQSVPEMKLRLGKSVFIVGRVVLMVLFVLALSTLFSLPIWGGALLASVGTIVVLLQRAFSPERKPVHWPRWHRRPP
jgi:hypothetical protein